MMAYFTYEGFYVVCFPSITETLSMRDEGETVWLLINKKRVSP